MVEGVKMCLFVPQEAPQICLGFTSEGFPSCRAITNSTAKNVYFPSVLVSVIPSIKYVFYICFLLKMSDLDYTDCIC